MFGWLKPKCPVDPDIRAWVDERMQWLVGQFGWQVLTEKEIILPIPEHFPAPYNGSKEAVRHLFDQVCEYIDVDPDNIDLKMYTENWKRPGGLELRGDRAGTAGLYVAGKERTTIWLETSNLNDPTSVVATLAHELCHVHLLGGGRISREEADQEPLTDLATIFFGLGVFSANASLRDSTTRTGNWESWQISRQGYLIDAVLGYALALFAWAREEQSPSWDRYLRADIRALFRKSLAYLEYVNADVIVAPRKNETMAAGPYSPELVSRLLLKRSARDVAAADEAQATHDDEHSESDQTFTRAVFHIEQRNWGEAISLLNDLLRDDPRDGDAYQQRAVAYMGQGDLREALDDANRAVKHSPDDPDVYRVRGKARFESQHYQLAIADFGRYLELEDQESAGPGRLGPVYYMRGLAASRLNQFADALADLNRSIRNIPRWAYAYDARADVYDRMGEPNKAAADRSTAAELRNTLQR